MPAPRPVILPALLLLGVAAVSDARAELPQPSCAALAEWTQGFERRDGWAPNELGLGGRDRFNALFADPRTAALFGKPVLAWTPDEAKALAPHLAACADEFRRARDREASGALGALRIQTGREVANYLAALAEARSDVPRLLGELAGSEPSVALLRFLEAAATLGSADGAAAQANQALSQLSGATRNGARALLGALREIPQDEVPALLGPVAERLPALRSGVREAAEAELEEVPATLAGLQILDRRAPQLVAQTGPVIGAEETQKLEAAIAARRDAIGATLRDELIGQARAAPENILGAQMLPRIQQQATGQYAAAIGPQGVAAVTAVLRERRAAIGAALVKETLAGIAGMSPQLGSLRTLQQLENPTPNPAFYTAVGPEGMREIRSAAAARRAALGHEVAGALRQEVGRVAASPDAFAALDRMVTGDVLALLPAEEGTALKAAAAERRGGIADALLPAFRAELAAMPVTEESLTAIDRSVLPGIARWPASAEAEKARFAAVAQERRAAILTAVNRAEAGAMRGRIYEGDMVKIEFLDRTRVVLTAPGAPPVPGTYTEEADGRFSITAGPMSMVMTREGKRLVAGPVEVRRVQ
ncbi:hypothetical protein [Roseomonas sp. AR75]|uniref:hypothetical protein n=1 Tax=Roseomonas sp. AR75 TaxID=2562311 RepID=UPI0010BF9656|nr:hypothetical protein [Roseomonas sp. AR75]